LSTRFSAATSCLGRALFAHDGAFQKQRRWLIVPDGALYGVPFAALPAVQATAGVEIDILPSAAVLGISSGAPGSLRPGRIAVFADPVFDLRDARAREFASKQPVKPAENPVSGPPLARLAFSSDEARVIEALARRGGESVWTGLAATKQRLLAIEWSRFDVLHISSHAETSPSRPDLSWVAFSRIDSSGRTVDGFLRLREIYGMRLTGVGLVVLSGCRTGLGRNVRGEGVIGFARAFLSAGAARALVSLWEVDDQATAELMRWFYDGILGERHLRPAEALLSAQAALRKDHRWRDPFYWAGFILVSSQE
jgi:CHAT domain-containing protein